MKAFKKVVFILCSMVFITLASSQNDSLSEPQPEIGSSTTLSSLPQVITTEQTPFEYKERRNPVIPTAYTLHIRPVIRLRKKSLDNKTTSSVDKSQVFEAPAKVSILLQAQVRNRFIRLQQNNLTIHEEYVLVKSANGTPFTISAQIFDRDNDFYFIVLEEFYDEFDILEVEIPFKVPVHPFEEGLERKGLYWRTFTDFGSNETGYFVASKLAAGEVKRLFPVWEDGIKAKFKIIIGRQDDDGYHTISNMELSHTEPDLTNSGWVWDHFVETPALSAHHISIVVSNFAQQNITIQPGQNATLTLRAFGPAHFISTGGGQFALETASRVFLSLHEKLNRNETLAYPVRKLDIIFASKSNSMEIFSGPALGIIQLPLKWEVFEYPGVPNNYTDSQKLDVEMSIAKQIATQWFGMMVNSFDISSTQGKILGKGIALYAGIKYGLQDDGAKYGYGRPKTYLLGGMSVVDQDARVRLGAVLLKMMEELFGTDVMDDALLKNVLDKWKWQDISAHEIYNAVQLSLESHNATHLLPPGITFIKQLIAPWISTKFYPSVKITTIDNETISICQINEGEEMSSMNFWMPITTRAKSGGRNFTWLRGNTTVNLKVNSTLEWITVGTLPTTLFRTTYDLSLTKLILEELLQEKTDLPTDVNDPYRFLLNCVVSMRGRQVPIENFLELSKYLGYPCQSDRCAKILLEILDHFEQLLRITSEDDAVFTTVKNYMLPYVEKVLGVTEDGITYNDAQLEHLILYCAKLGGKTCIHFAKQLMISMLPDLEVLPFSKENPCPALFQAEDNSGLWDEFLNQLRTRSFDQADQQLLTYLLKCSNSPEQLESFLDLVALNSTNATGWRFPSSLLSDLGEERPVMVGPLLYNFFRKNIPTGSVAPELFLDYVKYFLPGDIVKCPDDIFEFIEENEKVLQPVLSELKVQLEDKYRCRNWAWWNDAKQRIHAWMLTQLKHQ